MRDIILALGMVFYLPVSAIAPAAGLLCWEWFSIMSPHRQVYSFLQAKPLNSVVAVLTLLGWLLSRERKRLTPDALPWLMLLWFGWMTLSTLAAPIPVVAWDYWDRVLRILLPVFLCFALLTTKARIHGMVWVLVIAIGYYGVKGGGYVAINGGSGVILGPPGSMIYDNNQLGLAVVMELPLVYYLWKHTRLAWLRLGLAVAIPLQVIMVFGSHSRGAVVALGVMMGVFWLRSDRKILYALLGAAVVGGALSMMPETIWERLATMHSVESVQGDASFHGRLMAWKVAIACARDYFPFGAGFYTPQLHAIFNHYLPDEDSHAAHSIYFQVLGEHGFIGLAIYLMLLVTALLNATIVIHRARDVPELAWAHDLADMIRVALVGYYVGGAALSMAYFDGYLVLVALTSCLREITAPRRLAAAKIDAPPARRMAELAGSEAAIRLRKASFSVSLPSATQVKLMRSD
jgi:putative inorganic carbon (HCO3(-)) transporter